MTFLSDRHQKSTLNVTRASAKTCVQSIHACVFDIFKQSCGHDIGSGFWWNLRLSPDFEHFLSYKWGMGWDLVPLWKVAMEGKQRVVPSDSCGKQVASALGCSGWWCSGSKKKASRRAKAAAALAARNSRSRSRSPHQENRVEQEQISKWEQGMQQTMRGDATTSWWLDLLHCLRGLHEHLNIQHWRSPPQKNLLTSFWREHCRLNL